ncbi:hypothetical protein [Acidithiobacillus sulfurivorans]|uniref:Uncharacterized protein n=1 Tax=Acidithiobacillus sulfurivorans TaxID=1958756 RepID=A0ABS5ZYM9_9PROT|nr:hypothetical protein [Acidithiobacillus sulfurivorans]MBU2760337.1 hypothetical protein [Acidithiobacillus sulfurivorans]
MPKILWIVLLCIVFLPVAALIVALVYVTAIRAVHPLDGEPTKTPLQERED